MTECLEIAWKLIQRFKAAHTALVKALLREGELDYATCVAI